MSALRVIHRSVGKQEDTDGGSPTGSVLIVTPGGLEHGGGIGRQMGYFLRVNKSARRDCVTEWLTSAAHGTLALLLCIMLPAPLFI